jgi:hypothetical protein
VASELSREELRRLARLGAARRLEELRQEEAAIRAAFPDLEDGGGPRRGRRGRPAGRRAAAAEAPAAGAAAAAKKTRRGRYKMSAAQKRAVSERMKKYWAARRKAKG